MLADRDVAATIAVRDLDRAKAFYRDRLGLTAIDENSEAVSYRSGRSHLLVYRSDFAGTNRATAATWSLGADFDAVMAALRAAGIAFEVYDMPGMTVTNGVHEGYGMRGAWFKDPDGNILHVNAR